MTNFDHKSLKLLGVGSVLAMLVVGGCAPRDPLTGEEMLRASSDTAWMNKQINVQKLTPIFTVRFDGESDAFTDMEKGRLLGFLQAQRAEFGETMSVELPSFDDATGVNENRYGAIGSFLEDQGFEVKPKLVKDGLRNSLRVYYDKYVATINPECTKGWTEPEGLRFENLPLPHMGCATASGLAQMIANPRDLVASEDIGSYDGERAAKSITKYRGGGSSKAKASSGGGSTGSSGGGSDK